MSPWASGDLLRGAPGATDAKRAAWEMDDRRFSVDGPAGRLPSAPQAAQRKPVPVELQKFIVSAEGADQPAQRGNHGEPSL
jgi:hypothetical protein